MRHSLYVSIYAPDVNPSPFSVRVVRTWEYYFLFQFFFSFLKKSARFNDVKKKLWKHDNSNQLLGMGLSLSAGVYRSLSTTAMLCSDGQPAYQRAACVGCISPTHARAGLASGQFGFSLTWGKTSALTRFTLLYLVLWSRSLGPGDVVWRLTRTDLAQQPLTQ